MNKAWGVVALALLAWPALSAEAIDGDTLRIGRERIRLCGIQAPEMSTTYGPASKKALAALLYRKDVGCIPVGSGTPCDHLSPRKSHKRTVAQCFIDGKDIAAEMVRLGYAEDWPKFSGGYYAR